MECSGYSTDPSQERLTSEARQKYLTCSESSQSSPANITSEVNSEFITIDIAQEDNMDIIQVMSESESSSSGKTKRGRNENRSESRSWKSERDSSNDMSKGRKISKYLFKKPETVKQK